MAINFGAPASSGTTSVSQTSGERIGCASANSAEGSARATWPRCSMRRALRSLMPALAAASSWDLFLRMFM